MEVYENLIGIDEQKQRLLNALSLMLNASILDKWIKKHHKNKVPTILSKFDTSVPLAILSGDVGCGKSALAGSIASPLSEAIGGKITVFETPSNIRGSGMVGELSNRITESFEAVKRKLQDKGTGLLIIDEADDIGTSRSQNQAHHEDRAGLNVLLKQLDLVKSWNSQIAVLLITNRPNVLDPALLRRASLHITFQRPEGETLVKVLKHILSGVEYSKEEFNELHKSATRKTPFSYSDLIQRAVDESIYQAIASDIPFGLTLYHDVIQGIKPSPTIKNDNDE